MPLNVVVSKIMERLPDFIPGDKLVELTQFTINAWEKMQQNQKEKSLASRKLEKMAA